MLFIRFASRRLLPLGTSLGLSLVPLTGCQSGDKGSEAAPEEAVSEGGGEAAPAEETGSTEKAEKAPKTKKDKKKKKKKK